MISSKEVKQAMDNRISSKNKFGLDVDYADKKLRVIVRDLESYTPDELSRELQRLSIAVN